MLRYHNPKLQIGKDNIMTVSSHLSLKFSDNTQDSIAFDNVIQSHHLMELLLNVDTLKHSLKDKYVPLHSK